MERSFSEIVKGLEQQLKEIGSERNVYEEEIAAYDKENKALKEKIAQLHSSYTNEDAKAVQTLKEIQVLHKKKAELREEEFRTTLKEKEKFIQGLQESLRNLKHEVEKCKLLDKEKRATHSKTTSQMATLKDKVNALEKENTNKDKQFNATKAELEKKCSQQHVTIRVLEDQLKQARFQKNSLSNELAQLKVQVTSDHMKKESEKQKHDDKTKSLQKQLKSVQNELDKLRDQHGQLETELSEKNLEVNDLKSQVRRLELEKKRKENELNRMQSFEADQVNKTEESLNRVKKLECDKRKLEGEISKLKLNLEIATEKVSSAQNEVDRFRTRLDEKEDKITKMQSFKADQVNKTEESLNRVKKLECDKRKLEGEISKLKLNLEIATEKVSLAQNEVDRFRTRLDEKEDKITEMENEVKIFEEEIEEKKVDEQHLQTKLKSLTVANRDLKSELKRLNEMKLNLVGSVEDLSEKLKREEKEKKKLEQNSFSTSFKLEQVEAEQKSLIEKQKKEIAKREKDVENLQYQLKSLQSEKTELKEKCRRFEFESSLQSKSELQLKNSKEKLQELQKVNVKLSEEQEALHQENKEIKRKMKSKEKESSLLDQKIEDLEKLETELSEKNLEVNSLKSQVRRLELEKKRKENDLNRMQSFEADQVNKTEESLNRVKKLECDKRKLEGEISKLKLNLEIATEKVSSAQNEVDRFRTRLDEKEDKITEMKNETKIFEEEIEKKKNDEQHLQTKLKSLTVANRDLKSELERLNEMKLNLVSSVEDLSEKLKREEKEKKKLEQNSFSASFKLEQVEAEQNSLIEKQKKEIAKREKDVENLQHQLKSLQSEKTELEEKCRRFEIESSLQSKSELQLKNYKEKLQELQKINVKLSEEQEALHQENKEIKRKMKSKEKESSLLDQKIEDLEKTIEALKESCIMLERQVEDLESFNNELIEKENVLSAQKNDAMRRCSELRMDLSSSKHQFTAENQNSNEQITELRLELRNEMNNLHEVTEQYYDLQQKYKNLELNASGLQRKLKSEKESHDRCMSDVIRIRADNEVLRESLRRAEENLHAEIDRCDVLEREKTRMLNRIDTDKLEFSHELVRLNCQGAQQAKLIDLLQSRVEELEASDKKKKKKKTTLYQAPLQYRELVDLLDEEKRANVKLQEQVNDLRSQLQSTNSKMKRMKHGMDLPLSPGSIAAISAIVKSPAATPGDVAVSPKGGKQRSKPRMHHNIPHRLSSWVCHRASRCSVCLATIHFGHKVLRCSECSVACHNKCRSSITNTCGLPGGLFEQFKEGAKPSHLSPITSVFRGSNSDQLHGRLKVLCGDDSWLIRSVRVFSDHIRIAPPTGKSPSKRTEKDDVIDLKQAAYVHTDLSQSELPNTAKQDLSYAFKVQSGSSNSCWPARTVYFLAAGFAEKHLWVEKLEEIIARYNQTKNISGDAKIFGNEILTMLSDEKLELNCSVPISEKTILFGCDEGLYRLSPSTSSVSSKTDMKKIEGVGSIYQLTALSKSKIVAIEGAKHRLVLFNYSSMESSNTTTLQTIEDIEGCHLLSAGQAEGLYYLCVASATSITVLKFNEKIKKFCKKKEIATTEPCTCMTFTACSVIIGSNNFYEVDLTEFKIDDFVDEELIGPCGNENVFPVSILKIKERDGRQEFLLCYHEFGLFVDGFGHPTRSGKITWSRMPLSFEYREPYLIIVQFNSLEVLLIDVESSSSAETSKLDRAFLSFPRVRYLGSAITEGAVYLSSSEGGRTSVFCCKGNMKRPQSAKVAHAWKRHLALSSSLDSLSSPTTKRPTYVSDVSSVSTVKSTNKYLSKSQQSLESDTSKWSTSEVDDAISCLKSASESCCLSSSEEESGISESSAASVKLQWCPPKTPPPKPSRRVRTYDNKFDPVSSTQV